MREEGFYWVRLNKTWPWEVAEWCNGRWLFAGNDQAFWVVDFINDERIRPPEEENADG